MARNRSHRRSRDDDSIATVTFPVRPSWVSQSLAQPVNDLRYYSPTTQLLGPLEVRGVVQPALSVDDLDSRPARVFHVQARRQNSQRTDRYGNVFSGSSPQRAIQVFANPKRVPVCVRRKQRRQVLFAKGKGGRGYRKPRWKERSYMRCY